MAPLAAESGPRPASPCPAPEVEAACARVFADPHLAPGALTLRLEEVAAKYLDGLSPARTLAELMAGLEEQCWQLGGPDNPGSWAASALARVRDWLGSGIQVGPADLTVGAASRKSKLNRALTHAAYHAGQILYVARLVRPDGWRWITVPPGRSQEVKAKGGNYLK